MEEKATPKLAVILHADVVDSTALVRMDEAVADDRIQDAFRRFSDEIKEHGGTAHEIRGDALVAAFPTASSAVLASLDFQASNTSYHEELPDNLRPVLRVGIAMGEVVANESRLTGEGLVLAQRLEQIAAPGGICIQDSVYQTVPKRLALTYDSLGEHQLKGFDKSVRAYRVRRASPSQATQSSAEIGLSDQSAVRYCSSDDGTRIAYAHVGEGPPVVFGGSWMTHLEWDWENWGHYISAIAKEFTVIRYDQRGNGLSDWDNVDITFERMVEDLKCVIDCHAFEQVAIIGGSQAASVSIAYAVEHPEKVSRLILYGGYPRGKRRRGDPEAVAESEALVTLIRQGWGRDNPAYRQLVTSTFMPGASQEAQARFNEFQKACGPAENIARFREMFDEMDVMALLGKVSVPTLVLHCVGDAVAPLAEGKLLASRIPGAELVTLDSDEHMILEHAPEFDRSLEAIRTFLRLDHAG